DVPVLLPGGRECDAPSVRRPGRILIFEVAIGELRRRRRAVSGNDEDVSRPVADPTLVVQLVAEALESARAAPLVVLFAVSGIAYARRERELRPVRRPDDL